MHIQPRFSGLRYIPKGEHAEKNEPIIRIGELKVGASHSHADQVREARDTFKKQAFDRQGDPTLQFQEALKQLEGKEADIISEAINYEMLEHSEQISSTRYAHEADPWQAIYDALKNSTAKHSLFNKLRSPG